MDSGRERTRSGLALESIGRAYISSARPRSTHKNSLFKHLKTAAESSKLVQQGAPGWTK